MADVSAKTLKRNSLYAALAQFWRLGSRFVLTPLIIAKIGLEGYGTWILLFSICGYVGMFNTSFGVAYSKFTAECDGRRDYVRLGGIISSGMVLIGGLGLLGLTLIWLWRVPILQILGVSPDLLHSAQTALLLICIALLVRMSFGCVYQILAGLQRTDLQYKLALGTSTLEFVVAIVLLFDGRGLVALAFAHVFSETLATAVAWVICRRLCPSLRISPARVSTAGMRSVISLGGRFQILSFLSTGVARTLKLLISALCGVSSLAVFELADKLLRLGKIASSALITPLMPAFANLHAREDHRKRRELFVYSSKLVAVTAVTSLGGLFALADQLVIMWTGNAYPTAAWTIRVLAGGQLVWIMTAIGTSSLRGLGTLRLEMTYSVIRAIILAVAFYPAYLLGGYQGMIVAILVARAASSIWFLARYSQIEGQGFGHYLREILLRSVVIGAATTLLACSAVPLVQPWIPAWSARGQACLEVAVVGLIFLAITFVILWFGSFSASERQYLVTRLWPGRRSPRTAGAAPPS